MRTLCLCLALLFAVSAAARAADLATDLAVIVSKTSKIDDISSADLTKYFKADKTKFPDGTKIVVVVQNPGRAEREAALKLIYRMSEAEYTDHFVEATFTGAVAAAPKALPSGDAVKKFVATTAGGLGYVLGTELDDSVKTVKIDGKAPGDLDYKLKLK